MSEEYEGIGHSSWVLAQRPSLGVVLNPRRARGGPTASLREIRISSFTQRTLRRLPAQASASFLPPSGHARKSKAEEECCGGSGTTVAQPFSRTSFMSILDPTSWVQPWALLRWIDPSSLRSQNATPLRMVSLKLKCWLLSALSL